MKSMLRVWICTAACLFTMPVTLHAAEKESVAKFVVLIDPG